MISYRISALAKTMAQFLGRTENDNAFMLVVPNPYTNVDPFRGPLRLVHNNIPAAERNWYLAGGKVDPTLTLRRIADEMGRCDAPGVPFVE